MPRISVIMPSYNHERFVGQAIGSVLSQTLADLELIVIDDGSTDGTADVIRSFTDPRIRTVLRDRNVGSAQGTNEGLRLARAPFVAMISSDDFFEPHKLESQLRVLDEFPQVSAVFCRPRIVDETGHEYGAGTHPLQRQFSTGRWPRPELLRRLFLHGNFLCHPSVLVRRENYDRVGFHDVRMSSLGDFDMWIRTAVACQGDFLVLDEQLMSFRIHSANTSGPSPANLQCGDNEWPLIADRLRALRDDPGLFAAAFPEMSGLLRGDPVDVDYALGRLATTHFVRSVRSYGLRRLYDMMADDAMSGRLAAVHGFTTRDLIKLSQQTDTTGIAAAAQPADRTGRRPRFLHRVVRETRRLARRIRHSPP